MDKHLNLSQRIEIENKLNEGKSFRQIADTIGKPHTTVSREVESRRIFKKGNSFNTTNMKCKKIEKAPFVCNGCPNKNKCRKNKYFYFAEDADNDYKKNISWI